MSTIENINESGKNSLEAIGEYFEYRREYEEEMTTESLIYTLAYLVQLVAYAVKAYEKIDQRDDMIDKMQSFMEYLHNTKHGIDYAQLPKIRSVLGMPGREFNYCETSTRYLSQAKDDADGLMKMEEMYAAASPLGAPDGWGMHDAQLIYPLANAVAGELMVTTGKRRVEDYNAKRAELVHKGHINVRGLFTASTVLSYYQQAQSIYAGLADLYISGFNSAGAGLGVSLQRLASSGATGGTTVTVGMGGTTSNFYGIGRTPMSTTGGGAGGFGGPASGGGTP